MEMKVTIRAVMAEDDLPSCRERRVPDRSPELPRSSLPGASAAYAAAARIVSARLHGGTTWYIWPYVMPK